MVLPVCSRADSLEEKIRGQVLDAAEQLFYTRGIHAVGMDDIRTAAGVSLKRLYQLYPSKSDLVIASLDRFDHALRRRVRDYVHTRPDPQDRVLALFDFLEELFTEHDFRGCAWINANGELGATETDIARLACDHKAAFRSLIADLISDAGLSSTLTDQINLLIQGALVTAGITRTTQPAITARTAAATLITAVQTQ